MAPSTISIHPSDLMSAGFPDRAILCNAPRTSKLRNATTAECQTSEGHTVEVSFWLVDPPGVSYLSVHCPGHGEDDFSGEPVVGLDEGRPMMVRMPDAKLSFANFARSLVAGAMTSLKIGMDILVEEKVQIDSLLGHGGYFKTPGVGQKILAAALKTPISVMETAGEGGPWGMALLAAYRINRKEGQTLEAYLNENVFASANAVSIAPDAEDAAGFNAYTARFVQALEAERAAVASMK
jgi:hypothetical protein